MCWLIVALGLAVSPVTSGYAAETESNLNQKVAAYLSDRLDSCWRLPAQEDDEFVVTRVQISLNQDGSLAGPPKVLNPAPGAEGKRFNESAVRAITHCAPFAGLAAYFDSYQAWREITVNFDTRVMSSGTQQK